MLYVTQSPEADVMVALQSICRSNSLDLIVEPVTNASRALTQREGWRLVLCSAGMSASEEQTCLDVLKGVQASLPGIFAIAFGQQAENGPRFRLDAFAAGARMVTSDLSAVESVTRFIASQGSRGGRFACPGGCGIGCLTEDELHRHFPLYHSCEPNITVACPICNRIADERDGGIDVHLHNEHGPFEDREPERAPYAAFSWVVCQRPSDGRFLMVNEPAGISGGKPLYWLPAGRVDIGESLVDAAKRETREEAGIDAEIIGVLSFMLGRHRSGPPIVRVVFLARPTPEDSCKAKTIPDFESCGTVWTSVEDVNKLRGSKHFRSPEPLKFFPAVAQGQLNAQPIDTKAFQDLDSKIIALTKSKRSIAPDALEEVWAGLKRAYPASAIEEH